MNHSSQTSRNVVLNIKTNTPCGSFELLVSFINNMIVLAWWEDYKGWSQPCTYATQPLTFTTMVAYKV